MHCAFRESVGMSKIFITECGDTGAFFLFAILTYLGCDTGFTYDDILQEMGARRPTFGPFIGDVWTTKSSPTFLYNPSVAVDLPTFVNDKHLVIEHIILPVRDYFAYLEWKRKHDRGHHYPKQYLAKIEESIAIFINEMVTRDLNITFLDYDRMINYRSYTYKQLQPILDAHGIRSTDFYQAYDIARKHAIQYKWLDFSGLLKNASERRLMRQYDSMVYLQDRKTNVYTYTHGFPTARGCTNQVFLMINALIALDAENVPSIVFLNRFYAKFDDPSSGIPWSDILDLAFVNQCLKNVMVIDAWNLPDCTSLSWGKSEDSSFQHHIIENEQSLPLEIFSKLLFDDASVLNATGNPSTFVDPYPMCEKTFYLKMPTVLKCIVMPEYQYHMKVKRLVKPGDGLEIKDNSLAERLLENVQFSIDISMHHKLHTTLHHTDRPISIVHLRNERSDAIEWWANQNQLSTTKFENLLTTKYVNMIKQHIPSTHYLVILTTRTLDNPVLSKLETLGYDYIMKDRCDYGKREVMAVHDLAIASTYGNGILICPAQASTFSRWLMIRLKNKVRRIVVFNLNRINDHEILLNIR